MRSPVLFAAAAATVVGTLAADSHGQVATPVVAASAAARQQTSEKGASQGNAGASYRSVFDGYRGHREERIGEWRAANDQVRSIGGWQAYAREGAQAPAASSPSPSASAGRHSGHAKP